MGTLRNPFDQVRPAGKRFVGRDESVAYCLKNDTESKELPSELSRYHNIEVGTRVLHPGYALDPKKDHLTFGRVAKGDKVTSKDVLDLAKTPMEELIQQKAEEAVYKSRTREVLGKGYTPGAGVPERTQRGDFMFGTTVSKVTDGVKQSVCPPPVDAEEEKKEEIYERSHHQYGPGQQRRDKVDWSITGVDPDNHKFGRPQVSADRNVVGKCLNPQLDRDNASAHAVARTQIVNKAVDDHRALDGYPLGKTRSRHMLDMSKHPPVYGKPAQRSTAGDWGTADCLRGDYHREDQEPDRDLGRGISLGFRNAGFADANRRFGLPSIRTDVPPRQQSVSSTVDFGTGPKSSELIFPSPYADHGVEEADFVAPRAPRELRALMARIGYSMSDAEFVVLYERAASHGSITPVGQASLAEFRQVLNEVLDGRDAGEEPQWFTQGLEER